MKVTKQILFILLLMIPILSYSQRWKLSRSEMVYGVGISTYVGDLGGASEEDAMALMDFDLASTRPALEIGYRYKMYERISVKASLTYGRFHGSDVSSKNENRDYSFSANLFELSGQVEYHITEEKTVVSYKSMSMRGKLKKFNAGVNLYVFLGIGGSYFKPKALDSFSSSERYDGNKNLGLVVPFGLGLKYPISTKTYVGLEIGRRFISSDYLDGFSPEQSEARDVYYFTVINVTYKIKRKSNRKPQYRF